MGALAYIVNHTKKQYFCCDAFKWGEVLLNPFMMYGILEFIKSYWNNNQIQFIDEYDLECFIEYDEVEPCWKEYREDSKY